MTALVIRDCPNSVGQERPKYIEAPQIADVAVDQNNWHPVASVIAYGEPDAARIDEEVLSHALRLSP